METVYPSLNRSALKVFLSDTVQEKEDIKVSTPDICESSARSDAWQLLAPALVNYSYEKIHLLK